MTSVPMKGSGFGWRHGVTLLMFWGFVMIYVLRVNLSVGLVAMLNQTALAEHETQQNATTHVCHTTFTANTSTKTPIISSKDGSFVWDSRTQGLILGSFFYGYIFTQIPGGWAAQKWGAKWVFGIGILWTSLLTLATPLAANLGVPVFVALRVAEGLGEGVTFPSMNALFARWAPKAERTRLPAFVLSGTFIGTVVSFILSGYLCDSDFLGGWPSVFYVFGAVGILWFILFAIFTTSSPSTHPYISEEEKAYILSSVEAYDANKASRPPWKDILTSPAVWAIVVSHTTYNWALYTLLTELPTYFKNILGFNIKNDGLASSLPYIMQFFVQNADALRKHRGWTDVGYMRKVLDCSGHLLPSLCLVGVGYVGCNATAAVSLLVLSVGFSGLTGAGYQVNSLDIAPQYAGVIFGLSNTIATIPGFVAPQIVGAIIKDNNTVEAWRSVFFIAAGFYLFSAIFYAVFAEGKLQPWAKNEEDSAFPSVSSDAHKDKSDNDITQRSKDF